MLSEETLEIAAQYGVHVAVMPCCQKDLTEGSSWKQTSKNLSIPIGTTMDLLLSGKMMASQEYKVRMKLINPQITPQNRIIICEKIGMNNDRPTSNVEMAHAKLAGAYLRAHKNNSNRGRASLGSRAWNVTTRAAAPVLYMSIGFLFGVVLASPDPKTKLLTVKR
jgi:hypothetical protein